LFLAGNSHSWTTPLAISSCLALASAVLIGFVSLGPDHPAPAAFHLREALRQLRRPDVGSVTRGYLGHMWELYAMWAWIGAFLHWAAPQTTPSNHVSLYAFTTIASGAIGCVASGWLADRIGKQRVIVASLIVSGFCAATIGLWAMAGWGAVLIVAHLWGIAVIADSGNFSALTSERADRQYLGTVLTLQVSAGFLVTFFAIQSLPWIVGVVGWQYAFAALALGPIFALAAMAPAR
ncbi:MAG: MFS transporter, partial [Mesorhizobium sp.]